MPAFWYVWNSAHGTGNPNCGLAALSLKGMLSTTVLEGNIDTDIFLRVLRDNVLPLMNAYPLPESVLVMDNASTHSHALIQQLCAGFGVLCVFLPPYSYDYNPIEIAFHQAKQYVRDRYGIANGNTIPRLYQGLNSISNVNAARYFAHCGYPVSAADEQWAGI